MSLKHKPIVLRHKHVGFEAMDSLDAALKIALKEHKSSLISKTNTLIVVQKTRELAPFISKMLRLPQLVVYQEKWKLEMGGPSPKFLITATIDIGRYGLTVGSQFKQTKDAVSKKSLVDVQSKVIVRGLDDDAVMYKLVKNYIRTEFASQRKREKRYMKKAAKEKARAMDHGEEEEERDITDEEEEEEEDAEYNAETEALLKQAEAVITSNGAV